MKKSLRKTLKLFLSCLIFITAALRAEASFLPDTGQAVCFSDKGTGKVITCPAPGSSLAQDGSYTINPPSYTVNADGTVFDNNTWLMWQQQDDNVMRSSDDAVSYCESLSLGGHNDWRLPTKKELLSIVNYGKASPTTDATIFPNAKANMYISSSHVQGDPPTYDWGIYLGSDFSILDYYENKYYYGVNATSTTGSGYVRCVRGPKMTTGSFADNGNGTVTDSSTGLVWQQGEGGKMNWGSALNYCEGLTLAGQSDWRLPNARELESLTDDTRFNPAINPVFFPGVKECPSCSPLPGLYYWSSTPNTALADDRWAVSFSKGYTVSPSKSDSDKSVRCVRGQKPALTDAPEISTTPGALDFWYVTTGESIVTNITISNIHTGSLIIGSISSLSSPFAIVLDGCTGATLSSLSSCTLSVSFAPPTDGTFTDALTITSNDMDHPNITVAIIGRANAFGNAFFLPDTGQTTCYDSTGVASSCPAPEQPLAQDGSYAMNTPSYTVNGDTVTDNNTRLLWQRQDDGVARTWADAINYCESLSLGGYTDWRLPEKKELFTLLDYAYWSVNANPVIDPTIFPNTSAGDYWSATPSAYSSAEAWSVNFGNFQSLDRLAKSSTSLTRCVRGDALPFNALKDNGNGTVTDSATGLMWQQRNHSYITWYSALSSCENLSLAGYTDWRMPNARELVSLTDDTRYNPAVDATYFPDVDCGSNYWTSMTYGATYDNVHYIDAHTVNLCTGSDSSYSKTASSNAPGLICVRGGNIMPPPTLTGTVTDSYTGLSLANAAISVTDSANRVYTASTDANGKYTITNLATGAFTASVTKTGYVSYNGSGTIASDHKTIFNVQMTEIKALTVCITSPQNGALLNTSAITVIGTTSNTATVTVNGVQALASYGTFTATLSLTDGQQTITATAHDAYEQTASQSISITVLTKGTVAGTVTDSDSGLPLASASVTIVDSLFSTLTASTGANGTYAIPNVTQGQFSLAITKDDYSTYSLTGTMTAGQTVTMNGGIKLQAPSLSLPAAIGVNVNSVTITWTTDQASDSLVTYGTNTSYGGSASDAVLTRIHSIELTGLASGTTYHFRATSTNSHGYSSSSADAVFTTVTPPVISGLLVSNITTSTALVSWITDQPTNSRIEYGTSPSYGTLVSEPTLTTNHSIALAGLSEKTHYHYRVVSTNSDGISAVSGDRTFWTRSSAFSAMSLGDYGNVTVMEVTGNYDARNGDGTVNDLPRQEIAKEFLRSHDDNYDFLVILSNFDFAMPGTEAKAFYLGVRSDVQGIGMPIFDNSIFFGSSGKLQGTIDIGNIADLGLNPFDQTKFEEALFLLAHEQLHRWGAAVRFKNADGTLNTGLLGKDGTHWSYMLDSDGSVLYGNDWQDNKDGTYTSTGGKYYSNLDLYLMGLIDKTKMPPMMLIENAAIDPTKLPEPGVIISGTTKTVTIDAIIGAEGERVPSVSNSQKAFKTAFIFVTIPGTFTGSEVSGIETLRSAWAGRFASLTGGKASVADVAPSISITIRSPAEGATISRPFTTVKGHIINSTGNETGVTVNGITATVDGSQFIAGKVPLTEGTNTITVTATDTGANTATSSITVTASTTGNYITLTANIESGIAPLETLLRIDGLASNATPTISSAGPVPVDFSNCISFDDCRVKMTVEGVYYFSANGTGTDGNSYQDTIAVTVFSKAQLDALLRAKWEGMKTALLGRNVEGGVSYFAESSKNSFRQQFTLLEAQLPQIIADMGLFRMEKVRERFAEYDLRTIRDGQEYSFQVLFMRDTDGIWRIRSF